MEVRQLHPAIVGTKIIPAPVYVLFSTVGAALIVYLLVGAHPTDAALSAAGGAGVGFGSYINNRQHTNQFGTLADRLNFEALVRGTLPSISVNPQWLTDTIHRELRRTRAKAICAATISVLATATAIGFAMSSLEASALGAAILAVASATQSALALDRTRRLQEQN